MYVRPISCYSFLTVTHMTQISGSAWCNSRAGTHFESWSWSTGIPVQNPNHFFTTMSVTIMLACLVSCTLWCSVYFYLGNRLVLKQATEFISLKLDLLRIYWATLSPEVLHTISHLPTDIRQASVCDDNSYRTASAARSGVLDTGSLAGHMWTSLLMPNWLTVDCAYLWQSLTIC